VLSCRLAEQLYTGAQDLLKDLYLTGLFFACMLAHQASLCASEAHMSDQSKKLQDVSEVVRGVQQARPSFKDLPMEAVIGLPVPVEHNGQPSLAFPVYGQRGKPPADPEIRSPQSVVFAGLASGSSIDLVKLQPGDREVLGKNTTAMPIAEYRLDKESLFRLYDSLIPVAFSLRRRDFATNAEIEQCRRIWEKVAPIPLGEFYRKLAPDWFSFLGLANSPPPPR
jgi:hypothetical protein